MCQTTKEVAELRHSLGFVGPVLGQYAGVTLTLSSLAACSRIHRFAGDALRCATTRCILTLCKLWALKSCEGGGWEGNLPRESGERTVAEQRQGCSQSVSGGGMTPLLLLLLLVQARALTTNQLNDFTKQFMQSTQKVQVTL